MTIVYINGEPRNTIKGLVSPLIVDHPSLPGRPCASHSIGDIAIQWLKSGLAVRTLGNTYSYSLNPPIKKEPEVTQDFSTYADDVIAGAPEKFDAIEVSGVTETQDGDQSVCERTADNPQFFSIYLHQVEGGVQCVADLETRDKALAYAKELSDKYDWPVTDLTPPPPPLFSERNFPAKVVIEITADGYSTTLFDSNGESISSRGSEMDGPYRAKGTRTGDFYDDLGDDFGDLADELECGFTAFNIASELAQIRESYE